MKNIPNNPNGGLKTILLIISVLVIIEGTLSFVKESLSGNIKHISSISKILDRLKGDKPTKILFLGNSLIGEALDQDYFEEEVTLNGHADLRVEKFVPDGTDLIDWYFIYKNYFIKNSTTPDIVFFGFAWEGFLSDQQNINPVRLGSFGANWLDLFELYELGLDDLGGASEFILAKLSNVFANRESIRNRVLDIFIPNYQVTTQRINDEKGNKREVQKSKSRQLTFKRLQTFLEILKNNKGQVVFIAMPIVRDYNVPSAVVKKIKEAGMVYIDFRNLNTELQNKYVDSMHLNNEGSLIFSKYLADEMVKKKLIQ